MSLFVIRLSWSQKHFGLTSESFSFPKSFSFYIVCNNTELFTRTAKETEAIIANSPEDEL